MIRLLANFQADKLKRTRRCQAVKSSRLKIISDFRRIYATKRKCAMTFKHSIYQTCYLYREYTVMFHNAV